MSENPDENPERTGQSQVRIRRAPRFGVFLAAGAVLGVVLTVLLTLAFWTGSSHVPGASGGQVGFGARVAYFLIYGIPAGILLGAVVALVLDRISAGRSRQIAAERTVVEPDRDRDEAEGQIEP